jgi:2-C-methyl-D-erythritol 4-phosphate cytidylyltransferase/2-C-methyl-D-erythritol 4-phosphate cytidylyltransferase/2-C-methyl-D-erythritol 2,4-cyclodiphosphate synthase
MGGGVKKEYRALPSAAPEAAGEVSDDVSVTVLESVLENVSVTVLESAFNAFAKNKRVTVIIIVHPSNPEFGESAARAALGGETINSCGKPVYFVAGGATRRISVHHGLSLLAALWANDSLRGEVSTPLSGGSPPQRPRRYVLIHDGARPWVSDSLIDRVIDAALEHDAAIPVVPLTDTPKMLAAAGGFIEAHPKRAAFALAQTPQGFCFEKILAAHEKAAEEELRRNTEWTDDAEIYGAFAGAVAVVAGDSANKKITFPADILTGNRYTS